MSKYKVERETYTPFPYVFVSEAEKVKVTNTDTGESVTKEDWKYNHTDLVQKAVDELRANE